VTGNQIDQLIETLWPTRRESVFALLDGARDRRIFDTLQRSRIDYRSLFLGELVPELAVASPYLVHLGSLSRETRYILEHGWGNSWGVFVRADILLQDLRRHFRTILQVEDENGRRLFFRFYDPRVLRAYLPTCTPQELRTVFGPIDSFSMENETGEALLEFSVDRDRLDKTVRVVIPPGTTAGTRT
jgi:hypothetical protein